MTTTHAVPPPEFDVFLAHNSQDKPSVIAIANELRSRGLKPWLDWEQIPPGQPFQGVIQQAVMKVKSVAIFIGPAGLGRWQSLELRSAVTQFVERGIPVIPVLLPGVADMPSTFLFLREFNSVRFVSSVHEPESIARLAWGITVERANEPDGSAETTERVTVGTTQVGGGVHVTVKPGVVGRFLGFLRRRSGEPAAPPPPRPPIVAKGLRSFDEHDADFFLALLPGARDLSGLPQSLRFWKTRFEETDPNKTFRIGLLYGPSGCGKSSLMKAGILPRLADSVIPIYVEATAEDTEARMLSGLRRYCQELPPKSGLVATLQQKKRIPEGKKLVIILDQFEQWLYDKQDFGSAELTQALAECDGERIQCVLMVRDDFWTPVTRFLRHLETKQEEGRNMAMVDLFDLSHARNVLTVFGKALGALDESEPLPKQQQAFVNEVVEGIARSGKVICVRLALFVEMLRYKAWTIATLNAIGGIEGLCANFWDETLTAKSDRPQRRKHERAAKAVFKALLPEPGQTIRGAARSRQAILEASGYQNSPSDFEELIQILDNDLHLITPTVSLMSELEDVASSATLTGSGLDLQEDKQASSAILQTSSDGLKPKRDDLTLSRDAQKYYQLTHDYLVPSLRDWLSREQKRTMCGRAELSLEERSALWNDRPENLRLPGWWEYGTIRLLVRRFVWTNPEKEMMRAAARYYRKWTVVALILTFAVYWSSKEAADWMRVRTLMKALDVGAERKVVSELSSIPHWAVTPLEERLGSENASPEVRAVCAAALINLQHASKVWPYLQQNPFDKEGRYLVQRLTNLGTSREVLNWYLTNERDASVKASTILMLSSDSAKESFDDREHSLVLQLYRSDPDAGVHGAAWFFLVKTLGWEQVQQQATERTQDWHTTKGGMTMIRVPEGKPRPYLLYKGDGRDTQAFYISQCPVISRGPKYLGFPDYEEMTWRGAIEMCNALSRKEGIAEYYKIEGDIVVASGGDGYRIPRVEELVWAGVSELACYTEARSGASWWGDTGLQLSGSLRDVVINGESMSLSGILSRRQLDIVRSYLINPNMVHLVRWMPNARGLSGIRWPGHWISMELEDLSKNTEPATNAVLYVTPDYRSLMWPHGSRPPRTLPTLSSNERCCLQPVRSCAP